MFAITAGGLGFDFAVAKTVAAVMLGVAGGYAVKLMAATPVFADPLKAQIRTGGCCGAKKLSLDWQFWKESERLRIFRDSGWSNLVFLGKWLMLAYLLQALLIAYVPAEFVATVIGGDGVGPVLLATLVGAPAYLNGYAAVPLLEGLIGQGIEPRRRDGLRDRGGRQLHPRRRGGLGAGQAARLRGLYRLRADRRLRGGALPGRRWLEPSG